MEDVSELDPVKNIKSLARFAYQDVAEEQGTDSSKVFASRWCEKVSEVLKDKLQKKGVDARLLKYGGWDITSHVLLAFDKGGEAWIADPTWQQFREAPDETLPHVLICKKTDVAGALTQLGIPPTLHHIWLQAK